MMCCMTCGYEEDGFCTLGLFLLTGKAPKPKLLPYSAAKVLFSGLNAKVFRTLEVYGYTEAK